MFALHKLNAAVSYLPHPLLSNTAKDESRPTMYSCLNTVLEFLSVTGLTSEPPLDIREDFSLARFQTKTNGNTVVRARKGSLRVVPTPTCGSFAEVILPY